MRGDLRTQHGIWTERYQTTVTRGGCVGREKSNVIKHQAEGNGKNRNQLIGYMQCLEQILKDEPDTLQP